MFHRWPHLPAPRARRRDSPIDWRMGLLKRLSVSLLAWLLVGCESTPIAGERFILVVIDIPTNRIALQRSPGLRSALEQGVSIDEVRAGRLRIAGCEYAPSPARPHGGRRHGYVRLPPDTHIERGDAMTIQAREADAREGHYGRFFGRYLGPATVDAGAYFPDQYAPGGRSLRCGDVGADGQMVVEAHGRVGTWAFKAAITEAARDARIGDDELRQGRIAIGRCSPGVDSFTTWKVRLPAGMSVAPGDYLLATAGADEAPRSLGPLSVAIRKVAEPGAAAFNGFQGRRIVACLPAGY